MRTRCILIIILAMGTAGFGRQPILLTGLGRPVAIDVDQTQLYVTENARVIVYSLHDFSRVHAFGTPGQGPGEFHTLPHVHITLDCSTDELIIGSIRKISYFSKSGQFIREVKAGNIALRLILLDQRPEGDRFLGWSQRAQDGVNYNTIVAFDHRLNRIKQLYREKDPFQGPGNGYDMLPKTFDFRSMGGKIFIPGQDAASIDVLNGELARIRTIRIQQEPIKVTDAFKRRMTEFIKTSPETKNAYPMIKPLRYPKYFPTIQGFTVDRERLYVMTWKREKGANEFHIFDLAGRFKSKRMIPVAYESDNQAYPWILKRGKLYQLIENPAQQEWELRITPLD